MEPNVYSIQSAPLEENEIYAQIPSTPQEPIGHLSPNAKKIPKVNIFFLNNIREHFLIRRLRPAQELPGRGVKLDVHYEPQLNIGGHVEGALPRDDPFGCWYACLCMATHFFEQGPRLGDPQLFDHELANGQIGHRPTGSKPDYNIFVLLLLKLTTLVSKGLSNAASNVRDIYQSPPEYIEQDPARRGPQYAYNEKLKPVMDCRKKNYTIDDLEKMLVKGGPVIMFWEKKMSFDWKRLAAFKPPRKGYYHASVIIGTDNTDIVYHDPERTPNSRMSINQFNRARLRFGEYDLMQGDPDDYQIKENASVQSKITVGNDSAFKQVAEDREDTT